MGYSFFKLARIDAMRITGFIVSALRLRIINHRNGLAWHMLFLVFVLFISAAFGAQGKMALFYEDFSSLDNWKPFTFPKIEKYTLYSIEHDGNRHVLKAESNASASAILYKNSFNVYEYPRARWRWKVSNVYAGGDSRTKEGDDYPIRVYFMFEHDSGDAGVLERMQNSLLKTLYGEYPPHSSLSYVWANKEDNEKMVTSPYTERAKIIFLEQGVKKVGTWQDESVNIVADYQKAFGIRPPRRARIAIMNDSDNTGESSVSYMEYIEVLK